MSAITMTHANTAETSELPFSSRYVAIWNVDAQVSIYEKNAHEKMYPASLTKIMTTLVALEHITDLRKEIVLEPEVFTGLEEEGAAVVGYQVGDQAQLIDLLYGIMLPSGADAARAIAIEVAGSEAAFVKLMNQKAQDLKLEHTHFVNVSGLHDDDHYTTAADMEIILKAALQDETFYQLFTADQYTNEDQSLHLVSTRTRICQSLGINDAFILGSKTGFTLEGGLCLASLIKTADTSYIVITGDAGNDAGSGQHLRDAQRIYEYLQEHYEYQTLYPKQEAIEDIEVRYGDETHVAIAPQEDIKVLLEKGTSAQVSVEADRPMIAPVEQGEEIAQLHISSPSLGLNETYPLVAMAAIDRKWLPYLFHQWWFIVPLVLIGIGTVIFFIGKRRMVRMVRNAKSHMTRLRRH